MAVSIKDVAKKAEVSYTTVSHVINESRYVAEETKKRVYAAMKELHYTPNALARGLRSNQTKTLALLVPDISNPYYAGLVENTEIIMRQQGYNLFLCNSREDPNIEKQLIQTMTGQLVSGMIIAPTDRNANYRRLLPREDFPLVFIDRETDTLQADTVLCDHLSISFEATVRLCKGGQRKRVAYIGSQTDATSTWQRRAGFKKAMAHCGLPVIDELMLSGVPNRKQGYELMQQILFHGGAEAVLVASNPMAIGVVQCLMDNGITIPQKVALMSFDDYEWAKVTNPPLTTIRQPIDQIAELAARILLERIAQGAGAYRIHRLSATIMERKSC